MRCFQKLSGCGTLSDKLEILFDFAYLLYNTEKLKIFMVRYK